MSCSFLSLSVSKPFSGILMQHEEEVSNRVPSHVQDDYIVFSLFYLKFWLFNGTFYHSLRGERYDLTNPQDLSIKIRSNNPLNIEKKK
jgi:hypothetical protein